jgi:ribonuclease BN (tRNA processing enzyme)
VVILAEVRHKGGTTLGVRVEWDGASVAYLPDHALADPLDPGPATRALIDGVDLLVHDAQFQEPERERALAYGHSTIEDAVRLADHCAVGRLLLTHHAPQRTDDELDALAEAVTSTPQGRPVSFARQGDVLTVRPAGRVLAAGLDESPPGTPEPSRR